MLFRKEVTRSCTYCAHGTYFNAEQILCIKKGVVSACGACRKFKYDPCKRIPPRAKAIDFSAYDNQDFNL